MEQQDTHGLPIAGASVTVSYTGTAGTVYVNGYSAARLLGGVSAARLRVTEIKV